MKTLTKDDFLKLGTLEQMDYINEHTRKYSNMDWLFYHGGEIYDIVEYKSSDTPTPIDDLFDYALDVHYEATDLQGKLFLD